MPYYQYLVDVSPVLVIFQAFPEHCHDLVAGHHIVGQIRDVSHLWTGWAPWVIRRCLSHLQKKQSKKCQCAEKIRWRQSKGKRWQLVTKRLSWKLWHQLRCSKFSLKLSNFSLLMVANMVSNKFDQAATDNYFNKKHVPIFARL